MGMAMTAAATGMAVAVTVTAAATGMAVAVMGTVAPAMAAVTERVAAARATGAVGAVTTVVGLRETVMLGTVVGSSEEARARAVG